MGLSIYEEVPNYSTWSQNYIRRYGDSDVFDEIFHRILMELDANGFLDVTTVFGDGTHMKASANKRKATDKEVEIAVKHFDEDLLNEINQLRKENGKKPFDSLVKEELRFNEVTGEEENVKKQNTLRKAQRILKAECFIREKKKNALYMKYRLCVMHMDMYWHQMCFQEMFMIVLLSLRHIIR